MSFRQTALAAALMLAGTSLAHAASVDAYLPKSGVMDARLMVITGSPEDQRIAEKMKMAIAKDRAWFMAYVKQYANADVLPYDPRFGINKDEYEQLAHPHLQLKEISRLKITLKRDANGAEVFDAPNAKPLSGIAIAADSRSVTTPVGVLQAAADIHNTNPDAPTGPWNGVSFVTAGDPQHGKPTVELAFGKREKEGDGIMYYKLSASSQSPAHEIVLLYPLN